MGWTLRVRGAAPPRWRRGPGMMGGGGALLARRMGGANHRSPYSNTSNFFRHDADLRARKSANCLHFPSAFGGFMSLVMCEKRAAPPTFDEVSFGAFSVFLARCMARRVRGVGALM